MENFFQSLPTKINALTRLPLGYTMYIMNGKPILVKLSQWGNSLGLRLPSSFAEQAGFKVGSQVQMSLDGDKIIIERPGYSLTELLSKVTPQNLHKEVQTGAAVGREEW